MSSQFGVTLSETLVALLLMMLIAAAALPAVARLGSSARTSAAARRLVTELHGLRWDSIATARAHGFLFGHDDDGWSWMKVKDGNGNGLRTAEVRSGIDVTLSGPHRLSDSVPQAGLGFPPGGPFLRVPPKSGWIVDLDDPIRLGNTELLSFSPLGTASSGTLYVTDGRRGLIAIVLYGRTGRIRVWRHDPEERQWKR